MILKNFIVFEGIDGAGTTTQLKKLAEFIPEERLVLTAEPTKNETGLFLRRMLKGDFSVDEKTAAYLFAADRAEHIWGRNGVSELTGQGKIVASDRYLFSSLAYQSVSCGKELPELLNSPFPLPEILFYFVINPEISLSRVNSRNGNLEIYEKIDFQKKTAQCYENIISEYENTAKGNGMKVIRINAEASIQEISEKIRESLKEILNR